MNTFLFRITTIVVLFVYSLCAQNNRGELVVQTGGKSLYDIRTIDISANGKLLASAGGTHKDVRVWDIRTGKMIQHYQGMKDVVATAALSPDGKFTAAMEWSSPAKVYVWNNISGEQIAELNNEASPIFFSADGTTLYCENSMYSTVDWKSKGKTPAGDYIKAFNQFIEPSSTYSNNLYLIKNVSGEQQKKITTSFTIDKVKNIFSNYDASVIAAYDHYTPPFDSKNLDQVENRTIYVFKSSTGELLFQKQLRSEYIGPTQLSASGELLAAASGDTMYIFSVSQKKLIQTIVLGNKQELNGRQYGLEIHSCAFTPDNSQIAIESRNEIRLYDCVKGNLVRVLKGNSVSNVARFSPSGESLIVGGEDGIIRRIDLRNGINVETINTFGYKISDVVFSPEGSSFAVTGGRVFFDNEESVTARIYNFPRGGEIGKLSVPKYAYEKLHFSKDGKKIITVTTGPINFASWDDFKKNNSVKYSNDEFAVKIFDAATFKELYTIPGITEKGMSKFTSLLPLADGETILVQRSKVESFNIHNGKQIATLPLEENGIAVTPDGKEVIKLKEEFIRSGEYNYYLQFYNLESNRQTKSIFVANDKPYKISFSSDGKKLALSTFGNSTLLFDFPSMKQIAAFSGVQGELSFRKDGKMMIVSGEKITFINIEKKSIIATLVLSGEKDFILSTPDNYYMATKSASSGVAFRVGLSGFPFEQFDLKYNRPDIVLERLGYTSPQILSALKGLYNSRLQKMGFTESMMSGEFYLPEAGVAPMFAVTEVFPSSLAEQMGLKVNDNVIAINEQCFTAEQELLSATNGKGKFLFVVQRDDIIEGLELQTNKQEERFGFRFVADKNKIPFTTNRNAITFPIFARDTVYFLDRINIYVNDVPVYGTQGISLRGKKLHYHTQPITLQLSKGKNKVQISVINSAGSESLKETFDITREEIQMREKKLSLPKLHIVSVGVSKYEDVDTDRDWTLDYSAKDAEDIASMFDKRKGIAYSEVKKTVLTNSMATKEMILNLKDKLQNSDIDDYVVLFFSGHGLYDEKTKQYFLSTSDVDFENPSKGGILYEDFESLLDGIPARNKLMLIDACNSGEQETGIQEKIFTSNSDGVTIKTKGFAPKKNSAKTKGMRNAGGTSGSDSKYLRQFVQQMFADLRRGTGATIISSSTGVQSSLESSEWNNGAFTFAVREGIEKMKADSDANAVINVSEIRDYVFKRVEELTKGAQTPTSRRENLENDFRVW